MNRRLLFLLLIAAPAVWADSVVCTTIDTQAKVPCNGDFYSIPPLTLFGPAANQVFSDRVVTAFAYENVSIDLKFDDKAYLPPRSEGPNSTLTLDLIYGNVRYLPREMNPNSQFTAAETVLFGPGPNGNPPLSLSVASSSPYCHMVTNDDFTQGLSCSFIGTFSGSNVSYVEIKGELSATTGGAEVFSVFTLSSSPSFIPEPSSFALATGGFLALIVFVRHRVFRQQQ